MTSNWNFECSYGQTSIGLDFTLTRTLVLYLVAALAGSVALQPSEVTAGVNVQEVGPRRIPNVHGGIVMPAQIYRFEKAGMINLERSGFDHGKSNISMVI